MFFVFSVWRLFPRNKCVSTAYAELNEARKSYCSLMLQVFFNVLILFFFYFFGGAVEYLFKKSFLNEKY